MKEKWGEKGGVYDNLPGYKYVDITYDTYKYVMKKKARDTSPDVWEKIKIGRKTCRFAQFPNDKKGILPKVLMEAMSFLSIYLMLTSLKENLLCINHLALKETNKVVIFISNN
mgnify:CR=1 FL=1